MILSTALYPWQLAAVDKLLHIRVGALYMEMGTGKTRTALEMIKRRMDAGRLDKVLWLCPCSVRESLREEIRKHSPDALARIAVAGIESLSSSIRIFETLSRYLSTVTSMLIVDESNLVKNPNAIRTKRITALAGGCKYRLILNGTPISRNEADLFSQWYLLDWRILGYRSYWSFAANHIEYDPEIKGKIRRTLNTDYLIEKIAPYSYQVSRSECFELPGKVYTTVHTQMTAAQDRHYTEVVDRMLQELDDQVPSTIYRMFSAAQAVISGLRVDLSDRHMRTSPMFADPAQNPRTQDLLSLLDGIEGQTIIFCKYVHEIEALLRLLPGAVPFYGKLSAKARQNSLEAFKGGARYLIANKTCAGYGLNLQFCHNVIYYSNDWDWATRIQSEDRVYRLGQAEQVHIYDLCAVASLDVKILKCLSRKESLEEAVKRELRNANGTRDARGEFKKWLKGELSDGKAVPEQKCV